MDLEQGTLLKGRYRIQNVLGKGGMGAVYRALDESLGVNVAVKENLVEDEDAIRQFRREATILAGLRHPNLPRVTDHFVIPDQGQYLVMDFIEGEDLKMRIQRAGALPEKEVLLIGIAISDALAYLHKLTPPVYHRDIKPANIRITPSGQVYLVDFGLAKVEQAGQATATGARGLTPGYSPPEQYGTARTDARSDIYALGATLYTALTGFPPEDGLAVAINQTTLTSVQQRSPKTSRQVAVIIEKALKVNKEDRYSSAAEFKQVMLDASETVTRAVASGEVTIAPPPAEALDATRVAGDVTLPADGNFPPPPVMAGKPPAAPAGGQRNPLLWVAIVAGVLGILAIVIVAGFLVVPRLLAGSATNTPLAVAGQTGNSPTSTQAGVIANTEAPTPTETPLPTDTPIPTETPLPTATFTPAPTPQGGGGGQIAFASNRSGEVQIWLMDIASKELTQLTKMSGGACQPTWSPDGLRIAFIAPCKQNQQTYSGSSLFVMNADGTHVNPLPSSPIGDYDPAWSPVDNMILFTSTRDYDRPQIWMLNVDTGESVNLSNNVVSEFHATWSPDGQLILFSSTRAIGRGKLWVMDRQGGNLIEFSHSDTRTNVEPDWAPDGELIVYTQFGIRGGGIPNLMGSYWRGGGAQTGLVEFRLTDNPAGMREPDISPDGYWLVFTSDPTPNNYDLYLMRINGSELTELLTGDYQDFDPAWKPVP